MKRRLRTWAAPLLVRALVVCTRALPRRTGLRLFSRFGSLAFALDRKDRARAARNLALAFPDGDPMIVAAMAKGSFIALGRNACDALRLAYLSKEQMLDLCAIDGEAHLWEACRAGKGVIALTGRIGCWEILPVYLSCKGYKVSVMFGDTYGRRITDMLISARGRHGVASIPGVDPAVAGLAVLERGGILGMLFDRHAGASGSMVPFFGAPACMPREAAAFAVRSGASVVPMAIHMQPDGRHRVTVLPAIDPPEPASSELERIDEYTRGAALAIEGLVRMYPQQWVWSSGRWDGKETVDCAGSSREPLFGATESRK